MKRLTISLIILTSFAFNFYAQNNANCSDSIISLIKDPLNKTKDIFKEVIKCNKYNFMYKCDSLVKTDKKFNLYDQRISYIYTNLSLSVKINDTLIRSKLIDSHLIMLEAGPYESSVILNNLAYNFTKEEFSKENIKRIIEIYPEIKGSALHGFLRLVGKLEIRSMIPVLKKDMKNKTDEETKRVLTATLIRIGDKQTTDFFIKSLDKRLSVKNKYRKDDIYRDLLYVHYMGNRKVYNKLFMLIKSDVEIFIWHESDQYGQEDIYWTVNFLAHAILEDNIKGFPKVKFIQNQKSLTEEQKKAIKKWFRNNRNYLFEQEYIPNNIFRR